jgi:hypothetical protein
MYLDLHNGPLEGEAGNEDNVLALEVHQHGGDVYPFLTSSGNDTSMGERRTCEVLKDLENSTCVGANMPCVCEGHAMLA